MAETVEMVGFLDVVETVEMVETAEMVGISM